MAWGRAKLSQTQTDFANEVKSLGLERGLENSKARHKTLKNIMQLLMNRVRN